VDDRILAQIINHLLSLDNPHVKQLRKLKSLTKFSHLHPESEKGWKDGGKE